MALPLAQGSSTTPTPTPTTALRPNRSASARDDDELYTFREGNSLYSRAGKDVRSIINANMFGPRGASLANSGIAPGSFSSNLKTVNGPRFNGPKSDLTTFPSREEVNLDDGTLSEKRQAEFRDMINKEIKIKIGSENLLEALLSKNSKQSKDQRLRVESELSSSSRKIAELKSQLEEEIERSKHRPTTPSQNRLSSLFRGSPLRTPSRVDSITDLEHLEHDAETESPTFVLAEILQALEVEGMQPDYYVSRANGLVELFKRHPTLKYDLAWSIFGLRVQTMLLSDSREVVAAGYRVTRHAIADRESLKIVRGLHTDSLVILSLVKESKATIEREQAMKFIRAFLDVKDGVCELANGVIRAVISVAEHYEDRLRNIAILTLAEILVRDASLISSAGGFGPLIDSLADGSYPGSESLVSAFLYLTDSPKSRTQLFTGRELEAPFAPFTDPLAGHGHEDRLKVNARSVASILSTWPGLFAISRNGFSTLRSLLLSLFHPAPFARDLLLDLLFDVLHIKPPSWTSSFLAGRRLTTYGRVANLNVDHIGQQSLVENEDDSSRVNLIDQYTALVLAVLVQCGLIKVSLRALLIAFCPYISHQALSDLIIEAADPALKRKTTLLLGEVLKLANYSLPSSISPKLQGLSNVMNSSFQVVDNSNDDNDNDDNDALSSSMIYQIDRVNRTLYRTRPNAKSASALANTMPDGINLSRPTDATKTKLSIDMDEIQFRSLIVETQVVSTANYIKWKWELIIDIIEGPLLNPKRLEEAIKSTKFLKRLIGFYRPFKYRFSDVKNTKPNQRYVRIGCILIKSLLQTTEGVQYLAESKLLRQLAECLAQLDKVRLKSPKD